MCVHTAYQKTGINIIRVKRVWEVVNLDGDRGRRKEGKLVGKCQCPMLMLRGRFHNICTINNDDEHLLINMMKVYHKI